MYDTLETLPCGTVVQHGKNSDRIYQMSKGDIAGSELAQTLIERAEKEEYSKIIAKSRSSELPSYINKGYVVEAFIPQYYPSGEDLFYVTYYLTDERSHESNTVEYNAVFKESLKNNNVDRRPPDISGALRECTEADIEQMVELYKEVFISYPFPIYEPEYIAKTMKEHIDYYCVEYNGKIVALASAEIDYKNASAEMTDFATLSAYRSNGYASRLLGLMETSTAPKGIKTFYTIARAISYGMNITFAKAGYHFGGRLKNNTNIAGSIESMNVWYKNRASS